MDDFTCPRCKTTKFQNPSMKMMVNVCGHGLCENCVDLLFLKGSGACPDCRIPLRRVNFRIQLFEDATVEREVDIRRKILRDYNKREEDFLTLAEYNDYLEEIESIIYNLTNNIEVIETNRRIDQYKRDNREQIQKSRGRLGRDEYELDELLEWEQQQCEHRKQEQIIEETHQKRKRIQDKEALIDELMFSNTDAKRIMENYQKSQEQEQEQQQQQQPKVLTQFSSGVQFSRQNNNNVLNNRDPNEGPLFTYRPLAVRLDGPRAPTPNDIITRDYVKHIRSPNEQERAGGFNSVIACMRALQEAFGGLYYNNQKKICSV